jgi:hypothetical protein
VRFKKDFNFIRGISKTLFGSMTSEVAYYAEDFKSTKGAD